MLVPRGWVATTAQLGPVLVVLLGGCLGTVPDPDAAHPAEPRSDCCRAAEALRAEARQHEARGELEAARSAIDRADSRCPESAPETWSALVEILADLGQSERALDLAARIERDPRGAPALPAATRVRARLAPSDTEPTR